MTYTASLPTLWGELIALTHVAEDLAYTFRDSADRPLLLAARIQSRTNYIISCFSSASDREIEEWRRDEHARRAGLASREFDFLRDASSRPPRDPGTTEALAKLRDEITVQADLANATGRELTMHGRRLIQRRHDRIVAFLRRVTPTSSYEYSPEDEV